MEYLLVEARMDETKPPLNPLNTGPVHVTLASVGYVMLGTLMLGALALLMFNDQVFVQTTCRLLTN